MRTRHLGVLIAAAGLLPMIGSCSAMNYAYSMRASGRELVGRVISNEASGDDGGTLVVKYRVGDENYEVELEVDRNVLRSHPKHSKCELLYLEDDPGGAIFHMDSSLSGSSTIVYFMIAVGLFGLGALLAVLAPGDGNVFRKGGSFVPPDPGFEGEDGDGDEGEEGDDPAFVGGRPI
jgi:hypothetical protein